MFLVASQIAWRRTTVQCNRLISRGNYGGLLNCDEKFCTTIRRNGPTKQRKLIQVRRFNDEKFRVERKVN